jgi:hypothetical protein
MVTTKNPLIETQMIKKKESKHTSKKMQQRKIAISKGRDPYIQKCEDGWTVALVNH